jgi:hypothetical protein
MSTLNPSKREGHRLVEVLGSSDPRCIRCVRGRPLTHYWPWIQKQVRTVMLPPHERVTDRSVSWIWSESGEQANFSAEELSQLRTKLRSIESVFRELAESGAGSAPNEVLSEVQSAMSALAASLASKSDRQLAAYAARTTHGIMIHSWSLLRPADSRHVRTKDEPSPDALQPDVDSHARGESALGANGDGADRVISSQRRLCEAVRHGYPTQNRTRVRCLWGGGVGLALAALMIAGFRNYAQRESQVAPEAIVARPTEGASKAVPGTTASAIATGVSDREEPEGRSGTPEGTRTAPSLRTPRLGQQEIDATEMPFASPSAVHQRADSSTLSDDAGTVIEEGTHAPDRPLVFPSVEGAVPSAGGGLPSNGLGLPMASDAEGGSAPMGLIEGTPGAPPLELHGGGEAIVHLAPAGSEISGGGRSLPGEGGGSAPLPVMTTPGGTGQAPPETRQLSHEEDAVKAERKRALNPDQSSLPATQRADDSHANPAMRAEAASGADSKQERGEAITESAKRSAHRSVRLSIDPWTFSLARDVVVSTRPLPVGLTDDSELRRQALLRERQAHAPRALADVEFTWGMIVERPVGVSESEWRSSTGNGDWVVRREGKRVLISFPVDSSSLGRGFQWVGRDSRRIFLSVEANLTEGFHVLIGDEVPAAVWISAQPGKSDGRREKPDTTFERLRLAWATSSPGDSTVRKIVSQVAPGPWLEVPLGAVPGTTSPLTISLQDGDSGWAWISKVRIAATPE